MPDSEVTFSDQQFLEELVKDLQTIGFSAPKWSYSYNVPIGKIAPCSKRKFLCDVVAYRDGIATGGFGVPLTALFCERDL